MSTRFTIFAGTANPALAEAVAREMGVQLGACAVDWFPDGEVAVQLLEPVRRQEFFLVQPTSPPVNDHAQCLGVPVIVLHKRRISGAETEVAHIVGEVSSRACLIVDDIISTGGTAAESINALLGAGARPEIVVAATHGLLLRGARHKLEHPSVREVLVTDTVRVAEKDWPQLRVVSIAPLIAAALERFLAGGSIGDLY